MPGRFPDGGGFPYLPKGIVFPPYNPPLFYFLALPLLFFYDFLVAPPPQRIQDGGFSFFFFKNIPGAPLGFFF